MKTSGKSSCCTQRHLLLRSATIAYRWNPHKMSACFCSKPTTCIRSKYQIPHKHQVHHGGERRQIIVFMLLAVDEERQLREKWWDRRYQSPSLPCSFQSQSPIKWTYFRITYQTYLRRGSQNKRAVCLLSCKRSILKSMRIQNYLSGYSLDQVLPGWKITYQRSSQPWAGKWSGKNGKGHKKGRKTDQRRMDFWKFTQGKVKIFATSSEFILGDQL